MDVGVIGGIPTLRNHIIDVTKAPYNADATGGTDCSTAIANAIRSAAAGDVIYLPAGRYLVATPIQIFDKGSFTIRGDGDSTLIFSTCGYPGTFYLGDSIDYLWNYPSSGIPLTSGYTKGSTTVTLTDTSLFSPGQLVQLKEDDDHNLPVMNFGATNGSHGATQKTIVVSKTATSLTLFPGVYWTMDSTLSPRIYASRGQASGIGIEDMKIECSGSSSTYVIWLEQCVNSWVKNVHIANFNQYGMFFMDCLNCEMRHSYLDSSRHAGTNGGGLLVQGTCASLFEDNIIYKSFPNMEVNFGTCGNVFGYNFCEDSTTYGMVGCSIDANHGPHNRLNLYEGNISPLFQSDGYFGSASDDIVFRNWLHGTSPGATSVREPLILNRFTRNYTVAGNLLGRPGYAFTNVYLLGVPLMGNSSYTGTAQLSAGRPWSDWVSYIAGTYTKGTDGGFLELDLDVQATTTFAGNYNTVVAGVPKQEALNGQVLPSSLYRASKPAWFGSLAWPAFDAATHNMAYDAIPAGYRYHHGSDPVNDRPQLPMNVRIAIQRPR